MSAIRSREIYKKIQINSCSTSEIWKKWVTRDGLNSFFPRDCSIELKIGGAFEMYFLLENEVGLRGSEGCKILSYIPERMLSFSWNAPPSIPTVRNHEHKAWVVLFFTKNEGGVEVELFHTGFLQGEDWDQAIEYFDVAWGRVLQRLEQTINNEK